MDFKLSSFKLSRIINNYWTTIFIPSYLRFCYYRIFKSIKPLKFQGKSYRYFYHWYNTTWNNERAVEIPIICKFIEEYKNHEILEIGNVLPHYFKFNHDVVDKYEKADGVINQDVADFKPSKRYDLIISISTLEHVGWDENPRDPNKIFPALENLKNCLIPGGKLVVTIPMGLNPVLDKFLETGAIKFTENYYLKRINKENEWVELTSTYCGGKFGRPFTAANVLFLGIYHKT
jgi:hypothetical protein